MNNNKFRDFLFASITLIVLLLIFHNSMYSHNQSFAQSGFFLQILNRFCKKMGYDITFTQFMIRKSAHFTEYFVFSFLLTFTMRIIRKRMNDTFFWELFILLAVPVLDETIQLSDIGRTSSVLDVLIDFVSCIVGMGICWLVFRNPKVATEYSGVSANRITAKDRAKCRVFTAITILFVLFIFHNSMFPGPQSSSQSRYVMNLLNHMLAALQSPITLSEHFVRKAGHFTEYFALGILMLITIRCYRKPVRKSVFAGIFFLLLVPIIDEFIQLFTPKRGSSVLDVLLDFGGGMAGMVVTCLVRNRKED